MMHTNRLLWRVVLPFVILAAMALVAFGWWIVRPRRVADQFIGLVSQGRFEEADAMLVEPSSIDEEPSGSVVITDNAGNASTISSSELPLKELEPFYFQPRPTNLDYLRGSYHFPLVSSGPGIQSELKEPLVVLAISTSGGIVISSIR